MQALDNFFRHEYGRLVALFSCRFGVQHIALIEDAVQIALMKGLEVWPLKGKPDNSAAWLYRVAYNQIMDELRQQTGRGGLLKVHIEQLEQYHDMDEPSLASELQDDTLKMLFVCCDEAIPAESQLVLALKTLCGFSVSEIACRLLTTEANVYKRLARARQRLQENTTLFTDLIETDYKQRLNAVHKIIYLLFTEGYLSINADAAIRRELCEEAIRLATFLSQHTLGQQPKTYALLALLYLHLARMSARQNSTGGLLLLEQQDRSLWNSACIEQGLLWLAKSAEGDEYSRYHGEAGIAAEHCMAPSFDETRWQQVVEGYELLEQLYPSPVYCLNRAVAVAEWQGPEAGLGVLNSLTRFKHLTDTYLYHAVYADLHLRADNDDLGRYHRLMAIKQAPTEAIRQLLQQRLASA